MGVSRLQNPTSTDANAETQIRRIEADGGKVVDAAWLRLVIGTLKAQGIYTSCKFLADANFAFKNAGDNKVSKLYDISGNNNDAVQATAANQPIWTKNVQGGRYGMVFDGTDDVLSGNSSTYTTQFTIMAVANRTANGSYSHIMVVPGTTAWQTPSYADFGFEYTAGSTVLNIMCDEDPKAATVTAPANGISFLVEGLYDGTTVYSFLNGAFGNSNIVGFTPNNTQPLRIGSTGIAGNLYPFNGKIMSLANFSVYLTTAQRTALEAFLNAYYSIY